MHTLAILLLVYAGISAFSEALMAGVYLGKRDKLKCWIYLWSFGVSMVQFYFFLWVKQQCT